jgi:hypothetical protein
MAVLVLLSVFSTIGHEDPPEALVSADSSKLHPTSPEHLCSSQGELILLINHDPLHQTGAYISTGWIESGDFSWTAGPTSR